MKKLHRHELMPPFKLWWFGLVESDGPGGEAYLLVVKLPSYSYEYCPDYDDYFWCRRHLMWHGHRGWSMFWRRN